MPIKLENVGIAVRDLEATIAFFTDLGLSVVGRTTVSGEWTDTAVGRLQHRHFGVIAVEPDGGVGPLPADLVAPHDREAEVREERDRRLEIPHRDRDVLQRDGHAAHATEHPQGRQPGRCATLAGCCRLRRR